MPVRVSLLELVRLDDSLPLWPAELRGFEQQLATDPADVATWGAAADWAQEESLGEPELGEAFRWIQKRVPGVRIVPARESWRKDEWCFDRDTLPGAVRNAIEYGEQSKTVAGLVAILAGALAKIRQELF